MYSMTPHDHTSAIYSATHEASSSEDTATDSALQHSVQSYELPGAMHGGQAAKQLHLYGLKDMAMQENALPAHGSYLKHCCALLSRLDAPLCQLK